MFKIRLDVANLRGPAHPLRTCSNYFFNCGSSCFNPYRHFALPFGASWQGCQSRIALKTS